MAKNNTEKALFQFTLSEGNLTKSTSKRVTEKMRKEFEIDSSVQYLEGLGDQFGFAIPSSKANIKNAALGSFSKKLLAMAAKMDIKDLNQLAGCRIVVKVEVFPAPEPVSEELKPIENNEF